MIKYDGSVQRAPTQNTYKLVIPCRHGQNLRFTSRHNTSFLMRPTLTDLADAAGVSTATVDRVLNNRRGVSSRTRDIVRTAARQIGYLAEAQVAPATTHLAALLPQGTNSFIAELRAHLVAAAEAAPGVTLDLPEITDLDPASMADALARLSDTQGVAVIALNHPQVHEALRRLTAQDIPVVTLASDLPDIRRLAYIGIDNMRAGRLAGQIITRFLGPNDDPNQVGKIAFFAGSLSYRGHQEREIGLRQVLTEDAPSLQLLELRESREDRDRAYALTKTLLDTHPDLDAIYNAGGGTSGIARALQEAGRAQDIIVVAHEATDTNKALLLDGTLDAIIDQDARIEAREALATLLAAARDEDHTVIPPRLQLILKENLPTDPPPPKPRQNS